MENHIIVGVGGTGGNILKAFRKRLITDYSIDKRKDFPLGYVYVDSSEELMKPNDQTWKVLGENAQLGKDSFLYVRSAKLSDQLDNVDNYPGIKNWIGSKRVWQNIVGNVGDDGAAAQKRRLGRFLFSCAASDYETIVKNQVAKAKKISGNSDVTFHVIAGLAGGTGSGSVVDVVAQTRKHFTPNISSGLSYKIIVYCLVPEHSPLPLWDKGNYHANGYAALMELNGFKVKQFIPHDVSGQYDRVEIRDDVFNACFLFTNANENGKSFNTITEVPNIVSDIIHHYIFLNTTDQLSNRAFIDSFSSENVDPKDEYDENAETTENKVPSRSKSFKAFGIKRIINPEEEVKEFLTFTFAKQAINQFKFNNWSDDLGFRDEPRNEDYHSMVNNDAFLKNVLLTDAHLMLSLPILPSEIEQKWKTIAADWEAIIPLLSSTAWANNETYALNELQKLCNDRFDKNFRKVGVPEFYKIKTKAKKDHAKEIIDKIEKHIFSEWHSGILSLTDVSKLCDMIAGYVENNLKNFSAKVVAREKKLEDLNTAKASIEQEWSGTGFLSAIVGKKKNLYQEYTTLMQAISIIKTELEAMQFAKELLKELNIGLAELSSVVAAIADKFTAAAKQSENNIAMRCVEIKGNKIDFQESIIKYYDPSEVHSLARQLTLDGDVQKKQSANLRNKIVAECVNELKFTKLSEVVTEDSLLDILSVECMASAMNAHDEYMQGKSSSSAIVGKNIIEQLYEKYGASSQKEALDEFVRNIVNSAGVLLTFDNSEISRSIPNNVAPKPNVNTMFRSVLVSMPKAPGKEGFIDELEEAFRRNVSGSKQIFFDKDNERTNEITVLSLTYCFPLRMVNEMKLLKQKYDLLLKGEQKEINELVLHLEGDGSQYPTIFVEKSTATVEKNIGNILLAVAMGLIKYQDRQDGTGKSAYCIIKEDEFGLPMPPVVITNKLSEIVDSETLKISDLKKIVNEIEIALKGEYLHTTKRNELSQKMAEIAKTILEECNNNISSPVYKKYVDIVKAEITKLRS